MPYGEADRDTTTALSGNLSPSLICVAGQLDVSPALHTFSTGCPDNTRGTLPVCNRQRQLLIRKHRRKAQIERLSWNRQLPAGGVGYAARAAPAPDRVEPQISRPQRCCAPIGCDQHAATEGVITAIAKAQTVVHQL